VDLDAFVAAHRAEWTRLDALVSRRRRLTGDEVDELVSSYQRTATHLSVVRSAGYDPALAARLSTSLIRARAAISGAQTPAWQSVRRFAAVSLPVTIYRVRWWWLGTAAGTLLTAVIIGWWVARSPGVQASLLSKSQIANLVNHQFRNYYSQDSATSFAFRVWTNNVYVTAEVLILGAFCCLPALIPLLNLAVNLGVEGALLIVHGRGAEFFGLIMPHGMLELSTVFLAAGAGLRLGWAIIDPGDRPRLQALAEEGRATITIALGCILMLATSGVIEAFVTPSPLPTWARIAIGLVAWSLLLGYVFIAGRRAARAGLSGDIGEAPDVAPVTA
jgi:uncharacterized membrane protein SpoIIM required for sporulation